MRRCGFNKNTESHIYKQLSACAQARLSHLNSVRRCKTGFSAATRSFRGFCLGSLSARRLLRRASIVEKAQMSCDPPVCE